MYKFLTCLILIICFLVNHNASARSLPKTNNVITQEAYVEKVTNGDTIKVRLLPSGERTPE